MPLGAKFESANLSHGHPPSFPILAFIHGAPNTAIALAELIPALRVQPVDLAVGRSLNQVNLRKSSHFLQNVYIKHPHVPPGPTQLEDSR